MFLRKGLCPLLNSTLHVYEEGGEPETLAKPLFLKHFVSEIKLTCFYQL